MFINMDSHYRLSSVRDKVVLANYVDLLLQGKFKKKKKRNIDPCIIQFGDENTHMEHANLF